MIVSFMHKYLNFKINLKKLLQVEFYNIYIYLKLTWQACNLKEMYGDSLFKRRGSLKEGEMYVLE